MHGRLPVVTILLLLLLLVQSAAIAEPIQVRYPEGSVHGFLALRSLGGKLLAAGDVTQTVRGGELTSRLVYRFKDGSIDDETAVFTQNGNVHLVRDHRTQKGPSFPQPIDLTIEFKTGTVTVRYTDDGKPKVESSHMDLPSDLPNGMLLDALKDIPARQSETKLSYLAATPKPRIIQLVVKKEGIDTFKSPGLRNKAQRYRVHVEIGGLLGLIAPLLDKEPSDGFAWISGKQVPAFIKCESPLYLGGPLLQTEVVGPVWQ